MTRKRKCKTNIPQIKKEKKLLVTRLIQINMKLEDYVYNNKQISTKDAAMYIQEISAYKIHCHQDERSLQVIEKLTRCMQRIIADQNTLTNNSTYISYPSPVYSLADNDRTQLNGETSIAEHVINPAVVDKETDLCNDNEDDIRQEHMEINVDVEMHRAISNLSIRDNGDTQQVNMCSQSILNSFEQNILNSNGQNIDCSQSILNNFDEQENMQGRMYPTSPKNNKDIKNVPNNSDEMVVNESTLNCTPTLDCFDKNKQSRKDTEAIKKGHIEQITLNVSAVKKELNKKKTRKRNTKIEPKSNNGNNRCKKIINVDKTTHNKDNKCQKVIERAENNVDNQRKTITNSDTDMIDMGNAIPKSNVYIGAIPTYQMNNTNINTNTESVKTDLVTKMITHPVPNHSISKIYNINVEDDLSWIENIRYVREITPEERDTRLIFEDSFWDNLTLPGNWNEQDFEYN